MTAATIWRLSRPWTLPASAAPVIVGALAGGVAVIINWPLCLLMMLVALLLQAATNMANEYFDFLRGVDDAESVDIAGVLVSGQMHPRSVHRMALIMYGSALLGGLVIAWNRGWVVLAMGLAGMAISYLYSAGPRPLAATPIGELVVGLFMGPLEVLASELVATGRISWVGLLVSVPVAFSVSAILLGNNLRDRSRDAVRGRRTMAVLLGPGAATAILIGLLAGVFVWSAALVVAGWVPPAVLVIACALPLGWSAVRMTANTDRLRRIVPALGRFHLVVGVLLGVGLALGRMG